MSVTNRVTLLFGKIRVFGQPRIRLQKFDI